jgi:cytochrome oxidase Cu insertion factor (SCO1/SenC/PrrC family)
MVWLRPAFLFMLVLSISLASCKKRVKNENLDDDDDDGPGLRIGTLAPEIEGKDTSGKSMTLSDYRGKVVMLLFWSST